MKKIFAIASLALLTSTAWAHDEHFGDNPDMYQSPITEHGKGDPAHVGQMGIGDQYASQLIQQPADHTDKLEPAPIDFSKNDPNGNRDILPN
ncbi:hypothetical protein [Candidatus Endoriftia persephone]|jgi:hypothetical protein|uniref:Secreted protein n=3 Tax=Gammaproteobacteria TaxID=1236 RepID=G2FDG4_9GAMM|nr:hypothetical protein [Candidatus Endoriftia persephone]EGV51537.1 hypothetical protein Rifp1Sym_bf00100 [endosymbiont of Riftia pachyptila (vent Ph05)]EGW55250.1 hypothetical protein TevJSym_ae01070 [endosymbiont of Tevnia jerichonana (vent Tica)]USF88664.1 urea transporter [Candidatus Endoriftia persephone]